MPQRMHGRRSASRDWDDDVEEEPSIHVQPREGQRHGGAEWAERLRTAQAQRGLTPRTLGRGWIVGCHVVPARHHINMITKGTVVLAGEDRATNRRRSGSRRSEAGRFIVTAT